MKEIELPIVEVTWVDAVTDIDHEADLGDPRSAKEFGGLVICRDVGYLVRKNRREVVLAVSRFSDDNTVRHSNTIPAKWVKSIIYLEPKVEAEKADPKSDRS